MTPIELKEALLNRRPVIHASPYMGEISYSRVSAVIYRVDEENKIVVSAELEDHCRHSVTITTPEQVRYKGQYIEKDLI